MRLIRVQDFPSKLQVLERSGCDVSDFAILSHLWSSNPNDEVLFTDAVNGTSASKPAYRKLSLAIKQARADGFEWLWVDTCCIDKASSTELSEALNSMFAYYSKAKKCYAYLQDVSFLEYERDFGRSRWWRRGFTLQELLAPVDITFFSADWRPLGTKAQLWQDVSHVSGVERGYLDGTLPLSHASIAKRMSWAAQRETTREEDIAYCLMGLFSVNMPLLYGEGRHSAFHRLQTEIMKESDDHSIFAWIDNSDTSNSTKVHGLLADSPRAFAHTGQIECHKNDELGPYAMTNKGLQIKLPLTAKMGSEIFVAGLNCLDPQNRQATLGIYLRQLGGDRYARVRLGKLESLTTTGQPQMIHVPQRFLASHVQAPALHKFFLINRFLHQNSYHISATSCLFGCQTGKEDHARFKVVKPSWRFTINDTKFHAMYRIAEERGKLSVVLVVTRRGDFTKSFALLIGMDNQLDAGFDLYALKSSSEKLVWDRLQEAFDPKPSGSLLRLPKHHVVAVVKKTIEENYSVWMIEITVAPGK